MATSIAQERLARSGQLPLSIRIFSKPYSTGTTESALDIINQYFTRWSDLDLCVPDICYRRFHAIDNHAPISTNLSTFGESQFHVLSSARNQYLMRQSYTPHPTCPVYRTLFSSSAQDAPTGVL